MRVVVTGATGNVGTAVLDALSADDQVDEIVGVARRLPEHAPPKVRFVQADVAHDDMVPHLRGADALVHLAWIFQPTHRPEVTWRSNAVGSARLFDAAAAAGVAAVVHASSVGAYSPSPDRVDESWETHSLPTAGYGREKAYVERVLDAFEAEHPGIRVVRLRPSFIFQRQAATAQRRIFAGPLLPNPLLRPGRLPVLPWPKGLRFQALHAADVAEAYRLAVVSDSARGAYNVAAEPVIDRTVMGELMGARTVEVPGAAARTAMAALWHLHAIPPEPALLDLVLVLPLLDTRRIRDELGWQPRTTSVEALREVLVGMADFAGGPTPTLRGDSVRGRTREVSTGVGEKYSDDLPQ
ncbi:MAG: NAD-dependent epimerase/dehydratase family protein [Actinomycetota bacterium]